MIGDVDGPQCMGLLLLSLAELKNINLFHQEFETILPCFCLDGG
jgi:hypothetical protein